MNVRKIDHSHATPPHEDVVATAPASPEESGAPAVHPPVAYCIADAVRAAGVSRTRLYDALARGELEARKAGRRTVIEADALRRWIASWPRANFGAQRAA